jgi:hypothetical protein
MRVLLSLALLSGPLYSQTTVKDKPADYPAHAALGTVSIGAEYLVHSIPAHDQTFFAADYLVVEVAVFPGRGETIEIGNSTLGLRLNGRKQLMYPEAPGFVAASMKYPDWETRPRGEVQAGMGNAGVTIGRPPVVGRFPDDPTPSQSRLPRSPKAPDPDDRRGIEHEVPVSIGDAVAHAALPEGAISKPVSGYIYFHCKAKPKSVKSLELVYETKAGSVTLKLL